LLLWGVEGGIIALLAFLLAIFVVIRQLIRLGWHRGGAMAALLFPIALHTQVEHPFYVSAYHWAVFLFLLFITFQSRSKAYTLHVSLMAGGVIKGLSGMLLILVSWFCCLSLYYSYQIAYVLSSDKTKIHELSSASQHPYFSDVATRLMLASLSKVEQAEKGTRLTLEYAKWAEGYLKWSPDVGVFVDLIRVYSYLEDAGRMRSTIQRSLYLFPDQPLLLRVIDEVLPTAKDR
jgi:O-antigen polymerase